MPPVVSRDMITTQTDTTNIRLNVSDVIDMLSPDDVPLLTAIGKSSLKFPCDQLQHTWLEDELRPRQGTLAQAYVAGSGQVVLASGQGKYLVPDDMFLVGSNVFRVTSGAPDSDTLGVVAGIGDSTDANAASGTSWRKIAHAAPEGGLARTDSSKTTLAAPYNYTQIFKDWVRITGTMEVIKRYGYASERAYQEAKVIKQLAIDMEYALLYGVRDQVITGQSRRSSMGGLFQYIFLPGVANSWSTVRDAGGAELDEVMLNNVLQASWELGGQPDLIMVNGTNKRRFTSWGTPRIRTDRDERMAGAMIGSYESDFGTLSIVKNRWLRPGDVVLNTMSLLGCGPLEGRPLSTRMLPSTGDFTWSEILGEYTMEVHKASTSHCWIHNTKETY